MPIFNHKSAGMTHSGHPWIPSQVGRTQANANFSPMVITKGDLRIELPLAGDSLPENEASEESESAIYECEPVSTSVFLFIILNRISATICEY